MPVTISEYVRPRSLKEALELLAAGGSKALAVGGGMSIVLSGAPRQMRAVDLAGLGLEGVAEHGDALRLGAMATFDDIVRSPDAAKAAGGMVVAALRTAATEPMRRIITVGGNIAQCYYWATLPPVLLALGAKIHLSRAGHHRTLAADEFFAAPPLKTLLPGEIIASVDIPMNGQVAGFQKSAKTANDYALIHACASLHVQKGKVHSARVVLAACTNLPVRCAKAEEYLAGKAPTAEVAREAGRLALQGTTLRKDIRASDDYRRKTAAVYVERAINNAAASI